jgi:hypothetical protein
MDRRVDREDKAEQQKVPRSAWPSAIPLGSPAAQVAAGKQEGDRHEKPCPKDRLAGGLCLGLTLATQKSGGKGLHRAIGDDPEREEAADQEERLAPPSGVPSDRTAWK